MDAPVYIHFAFIDERKPCIQNQLFVIEERDGAAEETSAGEQLINSGNENEMVTILDLPDLGHYSVPSCSSLAVAKSRLFIVGGYDFDDSEEGVKFNEIRSVNLAQKDDTPSWETSPLGDRPEDFDFVCGTAVYGNLIYGLGLRGNVFALDPETRTIKFDISSAVPAPGTSRPRLLAVTDAKMYVNCASSFGSDDGLFGYCDIKSLTWHTIDPNARLLFSLRSRVVVVRDSYLISFALWHPVTEEFCPALYVYDIRRRKWLPEPVQGLPNDGIVLPSFTPYLLEGLPIYEPSLMQVRRDELKLALVWCISDEDDNEFHWSKFILSIKENGGQFVPPTFRAEYLSSACFSATGQLLQVNSITA